MSADRREVELGPDIIGAEADEWLRESGLRAVYVTESLLTPIAEQRQDEREARDHDDRDADPLAGIYRDDEPQEWRA